MISGNAINEDVKQTCDQQREYKIYERPKCGVNLCVWCHTCYFKYRLFISISPPNDGKKRPYNTVNPDKEGDCYRSLLGREMRTSEPSERITNGVISIHADGQKCQNRARNSDEVHCKPSYAQSFSVFPQSMQKKSFNVK